MNLESIVYCRKGKAGKVKEIAGKYTGFIKNKFVRVQIEDIEIKLPHSVGDWYEGKIIDQKYWVCCLLEQDFTISDKPKSIQTIVRKSRSGLPKSVELN